MARPQSPDYDKRRDAIVAAAARLFAKAGFKGASIADLAKACGASKSLIYHYFPSKEDILHAVMAEHLEALVEAADAATRSGDADTKLRTLARAFMRLYAGAEANQKVLLNELDNLPAKRRAEVVAKQRRIIATVEELMRALKPGAEPLPLAMLFFGMINWTHTWFRPGGEITPETLADMAADMALQGLAPSPSLRA